jgi:predicted TIM-barrel enzyme
MRHLALALVMLLAAPAWAAQPFVHPRDQLRALSSNEKQMWVVSYMGSLQDALDDLKASFDNGADAVVFETNGIKAEHQAILAEVRKQYPDAVLGVNSLGGNGVTSAQNTFEICRRHKLQIAWTDFSGVDLIKEMPEFSLHSIESARAPGVFYVSGVHMKYGTLVDPEKTIEKSALQAMGWVDGVTITGKGTGQPTDPDRARRARAVLGDYPLGAASGVTPENVHTILPYIDYVLVHTGIATPQHRIVGEKVAALRAAMDAGRRKSRK